MDLLLAACELNFIVAFCSWAKAFKQVCNTSNTIERQHFCQVRHAFYEESHVTIVCFGKEIGKILIASGWS